ncbi:MAG: sigma-54 dependent transcriptional regulator [Fusobacteria bacterium]|nr:sigma-54 dependent transcriptional regulator [Fusobacteriota bacterium]
MKLVCFNFIPSKILKLREEMRVFTEIYSVQSEQNLLTYIVEQKPDAILVNNKDMEESALTLVEHIKGIDNKILIFLYGTGVNLKIIISSMKIGAYDYLIASEKDEKKVLATLEKAINNQKLKSKKIFTEKGIDIEEEMIGTTEEMLNVYKMIGRVSNLDLPVLVIGETGTGKGIISRAIHRYGNRTDKPFVTVRCSTLNTTLFDEELFGFLPEANFEGTKTGKFELAEDGILCFEDISGLNLDVQGKLLSLLQDKHYTKVGGSERILIQFRIIYTTDSDLEQLVSEGKFMQELYHRVRVIKIEIPSLRERKEDIPFLVNQFIKEFNDELGKNIKGISENTLKLIHSYSFPGNIRELKNIIKSSIAVCRGNTILVEDLPANMVENKVTTRHGDLQDWVLQDWIAGEIDILKENSEQDYYDRIISRVERELITQILRDTNNKKVETAEILGITRNTLRSKMKNFGME